MTQGTEGYQAASASRRDDYHERVIGCGDVLPSGVESDGPACYRSGRANFLTASDERKSGAQRHRRSEWHRGRGADAARSLGEIDRQLRMPFVRLRGDRAKRGRALFRCPPEIITLVRFHGATSLAATLVHPRA